MHAKRFAPAKFNYGLWAQLSAAAVVLFPLSLHRVDFRATFAAGLSVSAYKSSPAYGAFEDLREDYSSPLPKIPDNARLIAAGETFDTRLTQKTPRVRQLAMKGITIRTRAAFEAQPVLVAGVGKLSTSSPAVQLAEQLVQQELRLSSGTPNEKVIRSQTGTTIVVRRAAPTSSEAEEPIRVASNETVYSATSSNLSTRTMNPDDMRPLWISGQVEMRDGLAYTGPETQMVIKRMFNGQKFEDGRIWISEGRFEIHVKQPMGFLVAELRTRDGRVLGQGEVNLFDLKNLPQKDNKIADLRIALHPTAEGASFRTISGYSFGNQKMTVADARVEIQSYTDPQKVSDEGEVVEASLSRESSFVARASAKNHWSSVIVGQARTPQDIRLFKNSLVDALISLNLDGMDRKEAHRQSVVWGRILRDGKPVEGAEVEMAGEYQPIYFNELNGIYLPDAKARGTSANGLFAFVKVRMGVQALRVRIAGKVFPAQVFPTEDKHVSYVEIAVHDKLISQFRVFDGLDMNKPVSAQIRLVGSDETLPIGKDDFVEYAVAANPFVVEADAGVEYELSRVTVTGTPHVVHVPLVQRAWLYQIASERRISPAARRGTIVGYMDDHDFEVELTGYAPGEAMQIVYFDANGRALDAKTGVAGGGFVIFNAPIGLQTLYIHPMQSRQTFSQIVVAEPEFVQVITH